MDRPFSEPLSLPLVDRVGRPFVNADRRLRNMLRDGLLGSCESEDWQKQ